MIESNLREKYSEEDIKQFYSSFRDNISAYEEYNSDGVDSLFGFLDFEKFKAQVLKLKTGKFDYTKHELESKDDQMQRFDMALFDQILEEDVEDKELKWRKILTFKEKKDILVSGTMH